MLEQILSKEDVNTSRQYEFDIAKGFAIIFMVITHVFLVCAYTSKSTLNFVIETVFGGPLAAPVFMTCMGIGICFSRNSAPKKLFFRGINLLVIAYTLNICRLCIPYAIVSTIQNNFDIRLFATALIGMDILQFAGLAFIFIALFKKIKINNLGLLCVIIICALIGTIFANGNYVQTNSLIANQLVGMFLPQKSTVIVGEDIAFPFFNWIIFPLFGLYFGNLIKKVINKNKFYSALLLITSILTAIYVFLNMKYGLFYLAGGSYYHIDIFSAVFYVSIVMLAFSIDYFLLNILSEKIKNILYVMSKHINSVYCIHWVIIGWCCFVPFILLGYKVSNEYILLFIGFIILCVSTMAALFWADKLKPYLSKCFNRNNKE